MKEDALMQLVNLPADPVLADLLAGNKYRYRFGGLDAKQEALRARLPAAWMAHYMTAWRDVSQVISVRRTK